ncbi:MAG: T9SS type A sorting domain-containing protein [Ferruginibacter sp.]|nr:T9SS type A sorting domain-containing protein [Ferruginibacter sp.]
MKKKLFFIFLLGYIQIVVAQRVEIVGPSGSGDFGLRTVVLSNGNYVLSDPAYDEGGKNDIGAVYLYNGATHVLISTIKGSTANDRVGYDIKPLVNGNFVVVSPDWDNGTIVNAGAVTWCNGTTGINGVVSQSNSLVGSNTNDQVGFGISSPTAFINVVELPNGNYVVISHKWNNGAATGAGAVTICNGNSGLIGVVSPLNSLVGTSTNDYVGYSGIKILTNGNFVVSSTNWNNGSILQAGAVTWVNANVGITGSVNNTNSLVGSVPYDQIGRVYALTNGNYVVSSPFCDINGISESGAVIWADGTTGVTGTLTPSNCFYGTTANDGVGSDIVSLANGNFVIGSPNWHNTSFINAGAVTWANGNLPVIGTITNLNSFIGLKADDYVGLFGIVPLPDGNYVVCSSQWDNGSISNVGAVTWANGTTALTGSISTTNSLIGSIADDKVGESRITVLSNGNYVVKSPLWGNKKGAITWVDKNAPPIGIVSSLNSYVGINYDDQLGGNVTALTNGNYVVSTRSWDNGSTLNVGAVTLCSGLSATIGEQTAANSIIGTTADDNIGSAIAPLANGNFVIVSHLADINGIVNAGAATWWNGNTSTTGTVSATNSLIGTTAGDGVGCCNSVSSSNAGITPLSNGDYIVNSTSWDGYGFTNNGAVTFCNGATGTVGTVLKCNSVAGFINYTGSASNFTIKYNNIYNYTIVSNSFDNRATIFYSSSPSLGLHLDNFSENVVSGSTNSFINNNCRILSTIQSNGSTPVEGYVNTRVRIQPSIPVYAGQPFVARHYEITPGINAATATGRITLYFTQQEFTDFNNHANSILDLPANPTDATGKSNLRIGKYSGTSNDGTGLPASYTGAKSVIDPQDNDIVWNATLNRWEVSFDVTGFSGFIVQTYKFVLPLQFLSFTAQKCNTNQVCLTWKTANEQNVSHFEIERSIDGVSFTKVGTKAANNLSQNTYTAIDDISTIQTKQLYYRIKQVDVNGRTTNSNVQLIKLQSSDKITIYPNPVTDEINIVNWNKVQEVQLLDATGKTIKQWQAVTSSKLNVNKINAGVYFLKIKLKNDEVITQKVIKKSTN